jgi:hypothetical protein
VMGQTRLVAEGNGIEGDGCSVHRLSYQREREPSRPVTNN